MLKLLYIAPRSLIYKIVGFDPKEYMIIYYCKPKPTPHPQLPVIVRNRNPKPEVWKKIFRIIKQAGIPFSWLELMCRPPIKNTTLLLHPSQVKPQSLSFSETSVSSTQASALSAEKQNKQTSYFSEPDF